MFGHRVGYEAGRRFAFAELGQDLQQERVAGISLLHSLDEGEGGEGWKIGGLGEQNRRGGDADGLQQPDRVPDSGPQQLLPVA